MNIVGIRLQQARKAANLSLRALGAIIQISHTAIKKYEDGIVYPSSDILIKLAKALHTSLDFFFRPIKVSLGDVKFRKQKQLDKRAEELIKFEAIDKIERRFELENLYPFPPASPFSIPAGFPQCINSFDEVELLAESLRKLWELGNAPIHNLIATLESHGIRVFVIQSNEKHFDGLLAVVDQQPIIVVSDRGPGDRQRFSVAHELGHYILANRLAPELDEELACNRFAGAFLFPRDAVLQAVGKPRHAIELPELLLLKEQYHLSMGSICYRLKELQIIAEPCYKKLKELFKHHGWYIKEPGPEIPPEKPNAFYQMLFHALSEEYIGESKAAELFPCTLNELKKYRLHLVL